MTNKQVERIVTLYLAASKVFAVLILALALLFGCMLVAEASNSALKDGLCEYMVIQNGEILSLEVFECSSDS